MNEQKNTPARGRLWLIPVPLSMQGSLDQALLPADLKRVSDLNYFIVENAKTARAFLKTAPLKTSLQELTMAVIDKHKPEQGLNQALAPLLAGHDIGLMSEAGCPAVADAGAHAVQWAHDHGCEVRPMIGPSALMLALMASGLNGQSFAFLGYLPSQTEARKQSFKSTEFNSSRQNQTQLAIETPYRARIWFQEALASLSPNTQLAVGVDLSLASQFCATRTIAQWRASRYANGDFLSDRLVVFSWLAETKTVQKSAKLR